MKSKPILVTGSRALDDTPEAKAWAVGVLHQELCGCTELWEGGCVDSPDEWASEIVSTKDPTPWRMTYCADGRVYLMGARNRMIVLRWKGDSVFHPRHMNDKMVYDFAELHPEGVVLALRAPWSKTHGTEDTIREARLRRLALREFVCPEEFGPRGGA